MIGRRRSCLKSARLSHVTDLIACSLGVFAYLKDELACEKYLNIKAVPCKFWRDSFYFSHFENLDQDRYVLLEGNDMQSEETKLCLEKIKTHLKEISLILSQQSFSN